MCVSCPQSILLTKMNWKVKLKFPQSHQFLLFLENRPGWLYRSFCKHTRRKNWVFGSVGTLKMTRSSKFRWQTSSLVRSCYSSPLAAQYLLLEPRCHLWTLRWWWQSFSYLGIYPKMAFQSRSWTQKREQDEESHWNNAGVFCANHFFCNILLD